MKRTEQRTERQKWKRKLNNIATVNCLTNVLTCYIVLTFSGIVYGSWDGWKATTGEKIDNGLLVMG